MEENENIYKVRARLVETGGRVSQDLGTGRIVGQVLVHLYLQQSECSLDSIAEGLGLSKASVSIAVRQLEQLGLTRKIWKIGDKRNYYKSADNIAKALQQGLLSLIRQKVELFGTELDDSLALINEIPSSQSVISEQLFLKQRVERAKKLQVSLEKILSSPFLNLLTRLKG